MFLIVQSIKVAPLDVDSAIPLGLIINELVTNSLKYAFPKNGEGQINIRLSISPEQTLCLKVSDNGVGSTISEFHNNSTSFGTDLIKILSKKLRGEIEVLTKDGYETKITFHRYNLGKLLA